MQITEIDRSPCHTSIAMIGFKESRKSVKYYFEWRKKRSKPAVDFIKKLKQLRGAHVLDIGCGYGPLTSLLLHEGADVTATEISEKKLSVARQLLGQEKNLTLQKTDNEFLRVPSYTFDVIFLFDVIEHVAQPARMLDECRRALKKNGLLYVEFTPYYSVTGHHLYDYAKWPIHVLPKEKIRDIVYKKGDKGFMTADDLWNQFTSLNKLRISTFQDMVKDFTKVHERFIIKYPEVFEANLPFLNYLGPFKDFFTMSYEGAFIKK